MLVEEQTLITIEWQTGTTLLSNDSDILEVGNIDLNAEVVLVAGNLAIRVTGQATKTIYWNAVIHIIQVSG